MISLRTFLFAAVGANAAVVAPTEPVVGAFPEPVVKPIKQADGTTEQAVKEDDVVSTAVPSELGEGEREVADLEDFADVDITAEEEQALLAEEMLEEMFEEEAFAEMMEFEQAMELEVLLEHIGAEIRKVEARKHDEAVAGKYGEPMRKLQVKVDEIEQKLLEAEDAAWKPVEKAEIAGEKAFLAKINEEKFQKDEAALSDEEKEVFVCRERLLISLSSQFRSLSFVVDSCLVRLSHHRRRSLVGTNGVPPRRCM